MDRVHKSTLQGKAKKRDENVLLSHFQAAKGQGVGGGSSWSM